MPPATITGLNKSYKPKFVVVTGGRKENTMNYLNRPLEESISTDDSFSLEWDEFDEYDFPYEDTTPEGWYYSKIMGIRKSQNRYRDECFDVYYKLVPTIEVAAYQNKRIDTLNYHYVLQRYKKGSQPARKFISAMKNQGLLKISNTKDVVGFTEYIKLEYQSQGSLGSFVQRKPVEISDSWFDADEDD